METEYLDALIDKAQHLRLDLEHLEARHKEVLATVRAKMRDAIAQFGLDDLATMVNEKTAVYVSELRAAHDARQQYGGALDSDALKVAEANLMVEVEAEFAAAGGRSNAEQRRAEVLRRLATDDDYRFAKGLREKMQRTIETADLGLAIAEKEWRAAMALYNGRVALVGAIGSIK